MSKGNRRIIVVLRIEGREYKFFSIFMNKDASYYLYQHMKKERSPLLVAETLPLLGKQTTVNTSEIKKRLSERGDLAHISFHPKRIYTKKRAKGGVSEHLSGEFVPQLFNEFGFRLQCVLTPPPISHSAELTKQAEEKAVFDWSDSYCPQMSLYELKNDYDQKKIHQFFSAKAIDFKIIESDGIHPPLLLELRKTNGHKGVWLPQVHIYGKEMNKQPISKRRLEEILRLNGLGNFDISSLSEDVKIHSYKYHE